MSASVYKIGTSLATALDVADVTIKFQNMAPDEAVVTLNRNVVENVAQLPAPLNSFGLSNYVAIYRDNVSVFWGVVQNPEQLWGAGDEQVKVYLLNVWDVFERTPFLITTAFANTGATTYKCAVQNFSATTLETLVRNVLVSWSQTTYFQIGTVDVPNLTLQIPTSNVMISEALRTVLKVVPGAMVTFDYSTSPPTIHVFHPASDRFVEFPTWRRSPQVTAKFDWKDRYDLQVPEVCLQYVWPYNENIVAHTPSFLTGAIAQSSSRLAGLWLAGHDATSQIPGPQRIWQTITLNGAVNATRTQYTHPSYSGRNSLGYYLQQPGGTPTYPKLVELCPPGFQTQYAGVFVSGKWSSSYTATATPVSPGAVYNPLGTYGGVLGAYNFYIIPDGMTPPAEVLKASDLTTGVDVWDVKISARFFRTDITLDVSHDIYVRVQLANGTLGNSPATAERVTYSNESLEAMPTGIAAAVKAAAATLAQQGTVDMEDEEALLPGPFQRKVTSPTGTAGVIQTVDVQLFAGRTSLTVGPPVHRTPDDWRHTYKLVEAAAR